MRDHRVTARAGACRAGRHAPTAAQRSAVRSAYVRQVVLSVEQGIAPHAGSSPAGTAQLPVELHPVQSAQTCPVPG